ncbi:8188_t:CDS:10 [Entrophospora sp. SA101]|nr:8188_t:CDS:10 [Entrophospora sp. SA101]
MNYLNDILIPRVPGTQNNTKVKEYITSNFLKLNWTIEEDKFTDITPIGEITFNNVIVTKNINAAKRLVLAAHYDSKYFLPPNDQFVGATDSALPCALLIDLANRFDVHLKSNDLTLQIIFFDGEEAFDTWTSTDSLYGSRHLAAKWESTIANETTSLPYKAHSMLDGIETLILLDLLGAKRPTLVNYFQTTSWLFKEMAGIEKKLGELNLLKKIDMTQSTEEVPMFDEGSLNTYQSHIEDDHVPFLTRGVPVLHLIADPFPSVWHTLSDDISAIDPNTVHNLNLIFGVFLAEYFDIGPSDPVQSSGSSPNKLALMVVDLELEKGEGGGNYARKGIQKIPPNALEFMDTINIFRALEVGNEHSICRLKVQLNEISEKVTPTIRGSVTLAKVLPKAKRFTFLVFATEEEAKELENIETASVVVGGEKLIQKILEGSFDFSNISNCLSTFGIYPEMKNKIAKVLGPLQLMPTEKKGTLTKNPAETINMLASKTEIKTDEKGFIRNDVGKTFWPIQDLQENISVILKEINELGNKQSNKKIKKDGIIDKVFLSTSGRDLDVALLDYKLLMAKKLK